MENTTKQTLEGVVDATLENPVSIEITIIPQSRWHAWLQRKGLASTKKAFEIKPIVLGNLLRISNLILSIDPAFIKPGKGLLDTGYQLASQHTDTLIRTLVIAIQNTKQEPSPRLQALLKNNLTPSEMMTVLGIILQQMELTNFISSIISIRGLNVLENAENKKESNEVSPLTQGS